MLEEFGMHRFVQLTYTVTVLSEVSNSTQYSGTLTFMSSWLKLVLRVWYADIRQVNIYNCCQSSSRVLELWLFNFHTVGSELKPLLRICYAKPNCLLITSILIKVINQHNRGVKQSVLILGHFNFNFYELLAKPDLRVWYAQI